MTKTIKDIIEAMESIRDCAIYIEQHMPELDEIDVKYQRKTVQHLNDYICMLENLEVKD